MNQPNDTGPAHEGLPAPLHIAVAAVRRRHARLAWAAGVFYVAAGLSLLLCLIVVVDAVWPVSPNARRVLCAAWLLAGGALVLARYARTLRRWRRGLNVHDPQLHAAGLIDQQAGDHTQPVTTALSLSPSCPEDPLSTVLRQRATQAASATAASCPPRAVVPMRGLSRPFGGLCLSLAVWLALGLVFPGLATVGLKRYTQPSAGHPPYSPTRFEVGWTPDAPEIGHDITVRAATAGADPQRVTVVLLDDDGQPTQRRKMRRDASGEFVLRLHALREPVEFYLEAHGRPTRRYRVTPQPRQQAAASTGTVSPDISIDLSPDIVDLQDHPESTARIPDIPAFLARLAGLAGRLAALAEQADALSREHPDTGDAEALAAALQKLQHEAAQLSEAADRLAGQNLGVREALHPVGEALGTMQIDNLAPGHSDPAPGEGADDRPSGQAGRWARQLADAARHDAASLAAGLGGSLAAIEAGQTNQGSRQEPRDTPEAPEAPGTSTPRAVGRYDETVGGEQSGVLPDAWMRQVPPRYREQTSAYFRRLAEQGPAE